MGFEQIMATLEDIMGRITMLESQMQTSEQVISEEGLSDIDSNLGLLTAGELRFGLGYPGNPNFTGIRLASAGMAYGDTSYLMAGVDADTLLWGVRSSDGSLEGGGVAGVQTLTDAATISWDLSLVNAEVTLGGDRTLDTPTNGAKGHYYILMVSQDGTGGRLLDYTSDYQFSQGTTPALSAMADDVDILTFYWNGTYMYHVDTRKNMVSEWSPVNVASQDLVCWLDANQISGKSDGEAISLWSDEGGSPTDHSLTIGGAPTFETNVLNGYPVVSFDAAADEGTFAPGPWAPASGHTFIIVCRSTESGSPAGTRRLISGSNNWLFHPDRTDVSGNCACHRLAWMTQGPDLVGGWCIVVIYDLNTTGYFRVNGVLVDAPPPGGTGSIGNMFIGSYPGSGYAEHAYADIAEFLIYDGGLSAGDLSDVEDYLNGKYNIY